jgi:hypothetical protein
VIVAAVDAKSVANADLLNQSINGRADDDNSALNIANDMWNNNCYYGVHVIRRYVDEWTYSDLNERMR